jgi:hypothetical protein
MDAARDPRFTTRSHPRGIGYLSHPGTFRRNSVLGRHNLGLMVKRCTQALIPVSAAGHSRRWVTSQQNECNLRAKTGLAGSRLVELPQDLPPQQTQMRLPGTPDLAGQAQNADGIANPLGYSRFLSPRGQFTTRSSFHLAPIHNDSPPPARASPGPYGSEPRAWLRSRADAGPALHNRGEI